MPLNILTGLYNCQGILSECPVEAGKLADFTVLSEDPTAVSPARIADLAVVTTIIDGRLRYSVLD